MVQTGCAIEPCAYCHDRKICGEYHLLAPWRPLLICAACLERLARVVRQGAVKFEIAADAVVRR